MIDENRRRVEKLREQGLMAIYGDATGFLKRRIIELAREANPEIDTALRTHRASELAYLKDQGIGLAIMGTRETAFGLLRYALSSLGLPDERARAVVQAAHMSAEGGAFEREADIAMPETLPPELREHPED